ncbi:hypothetical protein GACE_2255 [Geoglobus acetivorans]|uniref:Uncharacterized protein n=1 Tax=Geoglobus acetivorans TaxID=565033 RepID=A0A0A7GK36_GEOAI|nr:hypothetical protein GACE_2255 [Geoglobus acetivorans]
MVVDTPNYSHQIDILKVKIKKLTASHNEFLSGMEIREKEK